MADLTPDQIFETIFAQAVREELDKEIIGHLTNGTPIKSKPIVFETPEAEAAFKKAFDEAVNRDISAYDLNTFKKAVAQ